MAYLHIAVIKKYKYIILPAIKDISNCDYPIFEITMNMIEGKLLF